MYTHFPGFAARGFKPSAVRVAVASAALILCSLPSIAQNVITTIVGNGRLFHDNGQRALDAQLGSLRGVAVDRVGTIYTSDMVNHLVYKITTSGVITVVAGKKIPGVSGS